MSVVTFPYGEEIIAPSDPFPKARRLYRPTCLATLAAHSQYAFKCRVWLDTGADHCVFPLSFAKALGLNTSEMKSHTIIGLGGGCTVSYHNLKIDIGQGIVFNTYAGFTSGLDRIGLGVLGQEGFFSRYDVNFSHRNKNFTITP